MKLGPSLKEKPLRLLLLTLIILTVTIGGVIYWKLWSDLNKTKASAIKCGAEWKRLGNTYAPMSIEANKRMAVGEGSYLTISDARIYRPPGDRYKDKVAIALELELEADPSVDWVYDWEEGASRGESTHERLANMIDTLPIKFIVKPATIYSSMSLTFPKEPKLLTDYSLVADYSPIATEPVLRRKWAEMNRITSKEQDKNPPNKIRGWITFLFNEDPISGGGGKIDNSYSEGVYVIYGNRRASLTNILEQLGKT